MPRPLDEPIPPDEDLYRSISVDVCHGDMVLPDAVDLQGTSLARGKYTTRPQDACRPTRPREDGVAVTRVRDLSEPIAVTEAGTAPWQCFVVDDPLDDNVAHAELRFRRHGDDRRECATIRSASQRALVKEAVAARMCVLVRPSDAAIA